LKTLLLADLEDALDRCRQLTGISEFVVVGSQAILGAFPNASDFLRTSQDVDLFAKDGTTPELTNLIYKNFGPESAFEQSKGFYIESVGEWTMMTALPGWADRVVKVQGPAGAIGWCLSPLDIAYNKADAGREKDLLYLAELFRMRLVRPSEIKSAMEAFEFPEETIALINERVQEAIRRSLH
jgi:hypothetical protein